MATDTVGRLDEAYQRLHRTGPEFDGWLSNHGPMAAEAMACRALAAPFIQGPPEQVRAWLAELADTAVTRHLDYGHGNPVMLVHSATAPTAILDPARTQPGPVGTQFRCGVGRGRRAHVHLRPARARPARSAARSADRSRCRR